MAYTHEPGRRCKRQASHVMPVASAVVLMVRHACGMEETLACMHTIVSVCMGKRSRWRSLGGQRTLRTTTNKFKRQPVGQLHVAWLLGARCGLHVQLAARTCRPTGQRLKKRRPHAVSRRAARGM